MNQTNLTDIPYKLGVNDEGGLISAAFIRTRLLLYAVTPWETSFEKLEEVPNYFGMLVPFYPLFICLELLLIYVEGKKLPHFGESMCSMMTLPLLFMPGLMLGQFELQVYAWLHEHYRLITLPWDSPIVWIICILGVDYCSFLWHKTAHEVNIIWAFHQVHHTSQDFNLTIGGRLPAFNRYVAMMFYLPLALIFPPSLFYVHYQLNYLFQFWIHSDAVPKIKILDYLINNPSMHRVHHGRNRYCIDKNYANVFPFWDYLHGTIEHEKEDEKIYYGLVHPVKSFDVFYINVTHLRDIWRRVQEMDTWADKFGAVFKGPGWGPGKPWCGNIEEIDEIPEDKEPYDTNLPGWFKVYILVHAVTVYLLYAKLAETKMLLSTTVLLCHGGFVFFYIVSVGYMLEVKTFVKPLEVTKSALYFILEIFLFPVLSSNVYLLNYFRIVFGLSLLMWSLNIYKVFKNKLPDRESTQMIKKTE